VLSLNAGASQFPGERAHLERQKEALFPRHGTENLKLDRSRLGTCIADGHGKMLSRKLAPVAQWQAERA
jgi:hypothetical protein